MTAFTRRFALFLPGLLLSAAVLAATPYVVDGDGDAVSDEIDDCPYTHPGVQVDAKGCPLSREDGDLDGVPDESDDCPYSAAGAAIDAKGCALDSDFDGVANGIDRCPGSGLALPVDSKGCASGERAEPRLAQAPSKPAPSLKPKPAAAAVPALAAAAAPPVQGPSAKPVLAPAPIIAAALPALPAPSAPVRAASAEAPELVLQFNQNSTRLSDSDLAMVESYARIFARRLAANSALKLRITAYADQAETDVAGLVQARAGIVRAALAQKGIAPEAIQIESGVLRDGDASRNRRAEVKLGN